MGSSEGADGGIGVDCSVGTIVWVRRRNGSWWPGRILGQNELSASHLMSPRSGTPVKLLGREDASVDWYNLEKSKRVKAFRCGEFDACIERAEAAQGAPIKKREKYARREDAILHALELERMQQKSGSMSNNPKCNNFAAVKKELTIQSPLELPPINVACADHGKYVDSNSLSHLKMFSEDLIGSRLSHAEKSRSGNEMRWDNESSGAMPRMRGLQDFGLRIAQSKRRSTSHPLVFERSEHPLIDNHVDIFRDSWNGMGSVNTVGSSKSLNAKRKRSQNNTVEDSLNKRRDRRRRLLQVLKSSAKLPAMKPLQASCDAPSILEGEEQQHAIKSGCTNLPIDSSEMLDLSGYSLDQMQMSPTHFVYSNGLHQIGSLPGEDTSSGFFGVDETSSSEEEHVDTDTEEGTTELEDLELGHVGDGTSIRKYEGTPGNLTSNILPNCHPSNLSNDGAAETGDMGVSKWHMKGKRNIRNLTRRTADIFDGKVPAMVSDTYDGSPGGTGHGKKACAFKMGREEMRRDLHCDNNEVLNLVNDEGIVEKNSDKLVGFGKQAYPWLIKSASRDRAVDVVNYSDEDSHEMFVSGWEADELCQLNRRRYWGELDGCMGPLFTHPFNVETNFPLVDVNLKVQASYHGEHVPLVSLMSRLNGKAIIGHPILIEILEDGSSDTMLPKNFLGMDTLGTDEHAAPPVWRTGRRTAMQRVPRTDLAQSVMEGDEGGLDFFSDGNVLFKKPCSSLSHPNSTTKSSQQAKGKSHKKMNKGNLSSQKTRTLSSLVTEHKRLGSNGSVKSGRKNGALAGLFKPDGTVPLVACVPVKVVFSRILEAVGRPPSAGTAHRGLHADLGETTS